MNNEAKIIHSNKTLVKGEHYDTNNLVCTGWTEGDGSGHEGYHWQDYFVREIYQGPDENGIEPLFDTENWGY